MATVSPALGTRFVADAGALAGLISALQRRGYRVVGPTIRDGAVIYDTIESADDLPAGWTDEQKPGSYRLKRGGKRTLFGYVLGPHSWKRFLHPPETKLFRAEREGRAFRILDERAGENPIPYAFLGVRACELAAIAIQDRVLLGDRYADPIYQGRRTGAFLIAAQCTQASSSCFCASMGTGPRVTSGHDLLLTEVADGEEVFYILEAGTDRGAEVIAELTVQEASPKQIEKAEAAVRRASSMMSRRLETSGIRELLYQNFEHPRWDEVAARCLSCGNCTLACPTCFCSTVEDTSDVTGQYAERWRRWDSCFVQGFSYIHGGSVRMSVKSRYRQWLTHKLAAWMDQFGTSGCVGCGRCITWCPAGIDITEEVTALRWGEAVPSVKGETIR